MNDNNDEVLEMKFAPEPEESASVLNEFIIKIANESLNIYQNVIQYGGKEGQSLTAHILNCVFTLAKIAEMLDLSKEEQKLLMVVLCLHDINKSPEYNNINSYKHVATIENIEKEIIKLGLHEFMKDWNDYIEDIKILLHAHSEHTGSHGGLLFRNEDKTKLGKSRLDNLKALVRACDVADLSKDYNEDISNNKRESFLRELNSFSKILNKQYIFISHKVLEQRAVLTNLIHKNIQEYLQQKYNAVVMFIYPEGTYYLVSDTLQLNISSEYKKNIALKVKKNLEKLKKSTFEDYIGKDQKQGIKVAPDIIGLASIDDIYSIIDAKIQKKNYKIADKESEDRNKLKSKLDKAKPDEKEKIKNLLDIEKFYGDTQESMKLGELIRTFYIFLSAHCSKKLISINKLYKDVWAYIYEIIEFPKDKIELYSASDGLYQRAYMVSKDLNIDYEVLLEKLKDVTSELMEENNDKNIELDDNSNEIIDYVYSNVYFDFEEFSNIDFTKKLKNYVENNHKQCSCCNSSYKPKEMMSGDVPDGIKVQLFSNRLSGGNPKDPKRNICPVCKEQFSLEKLNFSGSGEKPIYLHMMSHSFMPQELLNSIRNQFKELADKKISAFFVNIRDTLKTLEELGYLKLKIKSSEVFGVCVAKYPEEVLGNIISVPVTSLKLNSTERYLRAIDYALLLNRYFNFKVLVSESAIPILNKNEFDEIYFDGLPSNLKGFIPNQNINKEDLINLWEKYLALRKISDTLFSDDSYLKLVLSLLKSKQNIFFSVDRLIEEKLRNSKSKNTGALAQHLSKELYSSVETIINK